MKSGGTFLNWLGCWFPGVALLLGGFLMSWHMLGLDLALLIPGIPTLNLLPASIVFECAVVCLILGLVLWGMRLTNERGELSLGFSPRLLATRSEAWIELLDKLIGWIAAAAMAICGILLFWSAMARYARSQDLPDWTFEVSVFCLIWAVLLGVARIEKRSGHIRVDFLVSMFPNSTKAWVEGLTLVVAIIISVLFICSGYVIVQETLMWDERTENSLFTPYWWLYAALPASFAVHLIFIVDRMRRLLMGQLDLNASSHL